MKHIVDNSFGELDVSFTVLLHLQPVPAAQKHEPVHESVQAADRLVEESRVRSTETDLDAKAQQGSYDLACRNHLSALAPHEQIFEWMLFIPRRFELSLYQIHESVLVQLAGLFGILQVQVGIDYLLPLLPVVFEEIDGCDIALIRLPQFETVNCLDDQVGVQKFHFVIQL